MIIIRFIPASMDASTVALIDARLAAIRRDHAVTVPLAIESGSRAWGFPSPDSDYDCRFVFIRPIDRYLTPWPDRDVIETPIEGDLDVNGWDLGKALTLMLKGNAVISEWLTSPIVYGADPWFRDTFLALARRLARRELIGRHYLHLGERQRRTYFGDGKEVALKKIFYALRPAIALRWLQRHPGAAVPPMHFPTLIAEGEPPAELAALVGDLLARKAITRELGVGPVPEPIAAFIDREFEAAREVFETGPIPIDERAKHEAEAFFRAAVERFGR
ncbi:nucleotidyltransferase domain-containing protein [Chelatococcus sp.]|uniref:nucleotidyltransferase domain-containing protein n=2 Tax=Chelatococcus TaxID=28209 RepID=UPI0026115BEE|nr:nucleotidyltransferase domain-containing protein [Chelatococcus sp.]